jgi:hypothetical protein
MQPAWMRLEGWAGRGHPGLRDASQRERCDAPQAEGGVNISIKPGTNRPARVAGAVQHGAPCPMFHLGSAPQLTC